jgi:homocysteine S-methyltransferase
MTIQFPLLIDGGLSNVLEQLGHNLNHKLWTAKLLEEDPESIIQAHHSYLEAGAQCITTSSYQAAIPGLLAAGYDRGKAEELLIRSVELAEMAVARLMDERSVASRPLIAASIGPYGAFLADGSEYRGNYDISDDSLKDFHMERFRLLDQSNADLLACETIPSFQEARVLSEILLQVNKVAWVSFSCKDEWHICDGTKIEECVSLFSDHSNVLAIGVNCTSPSYISGLIQVLRSSSGIKKIIVYPNSGEAYNASTKTWLGTSDPDLFVEMAKEWISLGADIVGGCCRIGPDHIRKLREIIPEN